MKALQLSKPHLLIVIGAPSSGKSAFASKFSETFHTPYISAKLIGRCATDSKVASGLTEMILAEIQKTKQTIIYEPVSGSRTERTEVAKAARSRGYETLLVWVQTDPKVAKARATRPSSRKSDAISEAEFDQELKRFTPPNAQEKTVVISGMHTYATQAKAVLKRLSNRPSSEARPTGNITVNHRRNRMVQ